MQQVELNATKDKDTGIAMLLSFFFSGAGQIYVGKVERGIVQFVLACGLGALALSTGFFFTWFIFSFYWFWVIVDAGNQAHSFNVGLKSAIAKQANMKAEEEAVARKTTNSTDFVTQLEKISKLHGAGLLDEPEYISRKRDLIWTLAERKIKDSAEDFLTALIPSIEKKYLVESEIAQIKKLVL